METCPVIQTTGMAFYLSRSVRNHTCPWKRGLCPLKRGLCARACVSVCFRMVAVLGLSTSLSAWLLLLMKMCADFCHRGSAPARVPPSPLRMLVGMSSITNSFTTGGVQPTIQADMRDRSTFTSALTAMFLGGCWPVGPHEVNLRREWRSGVGLGVTVQ